MNKHILRGYLGKDPESRDLDFGKVVNCSIATSKRWKDKTTGEPREKTEWHNLEFYGGVAIAAEKILKKGSNVLVCGESQTKEYTDKDGITRKIVSVNVKEMELMDKKEAEDRAPVIAQGQPQQQQHQHYQQQGFQGPGNYRQAPVGASFEDEVPF